MSVHRDATVNLTEHEKWQFAACEWLKSADGINTTEKWAVDIIRYDCAYGVSLTECVEQPTEQPTIVPTSCMCDLNYDPVCCNGTEYSNQCQANCDG
eukprot:207072_1